MTQSIQRAIPLVDSDFENATKEGYKSSEDYSRTDDEREFDGWVGDLGEEMFHRLVKSRTDFEVDYLGGPTDPDFIIDGVSVDVKTRTEIDPNKRDLIAPADIDDYPHDLYILLRAVYKGDWEDYPRYDRDLYGLELIAMWKGETVVAKSDPFNPYKVQGRKSENNRDTVICDYEDKDGDDWMDLSEFVRMIREVKNNTED